MRNDRTSQFFNCTAVLDHGRLPDLARRVAICVRGFECRIRACRISATEQVWDWPWYIQYAAET